MATPVTLPAASMESRAFTLPRSISRRRASRGNCGSSRTSGKSFGGAGVDGAADVDGAAGVDAAAEGAAIAICVGKRSGERSAAAGAAIGSGTGALSSATLPAAAVVAADVWARAAAGAVGRGNTSRWGESEGESRLAIPTLGSCPSPFAVARVFETPGVERDETIFEPRVRATSIRPATLAVSGEAAPMGGVALARTGGGVATAAVTATVAALTGVFGCIGAEAMSTGDDGHRIAAGGAPESVGQPSHAVAARPMTAAVTAMPTPRRGAPKLSLAGDRDCISGGGGSAAPPASTSPISVRRARSRSSFRGSRLPRAASSASDAGVPSCVSRRR